MTLAKGTRVASFDLPPTTLHTFDIQMLTGKKTVYTRNLPLVSPAVWCSMGGLRNTYLAFQMVAVANVGGGWATSGRTGLWVSETLVIDLEVVCWKLRRRQVFRLQIAAEFFVW